MENKRPYREVMADQMLDQVIEYAGDWDELLNMLAVVDLGEHPLLYEYLEQLVPRVKRMQRQFNQVSYQDQIWRIHNYSFPMFEYMCKQYAEWLTITPYQIAIENEHLNATDQDKLRKQLTA